MRFHAMKAAVLIASSWLALSGATVLAAAARAAEPIGIAILAPRSQNEGAGMFQGAALAAKTINANGGIDGRMIKLYNFDTRTSPVTAAREYQQAVEQDHVVAAVGIFSAGVEAGVDPWAARLKVPLFVIGDDSMEIPDLVRKDYARYKYLFRNNSNPVQQATQVCRAAKTLLLDDPTLHNFDKVAIVGEDAAWTKDLIAGYQKCLPESGFRLLKTVKFALSTQDFTPVFKTATATGANVFVTAWGITGVVPTTQWHTDKVPALIFGIDAQSESSNFWAETHGSTSGVVTLAQAGFGGFPVTSKTKPFFDKYFNAYHIEKPQFTAYLTYDAIYIIKHAIEKSHVTAGDEFVKSIADTNFTGVSGQVHYYGRNGKFPHQLVYSRDPQKGVAYFFIQWQNGKQYIVWPKNLAQKSVLIPPAVAAASK